MTTTTGAPAGSAHAAIHEVFRATSAAWAAGDAAAFSAWYAPEASVLLPGLRLAGREEIGTAMARAFAGPLHGTRRVHDIASVRLIADEVALVHTASATVAAGQDEPADDQRERVTWVLARMSGRWLIEAYHSSPAGG
ncbi:MAG: SgcJ/EcaC family oxidoreductase [Streptomyces sp.]|nr:SgcJ/EcaC family oxidoreductase [Streptomyces sp.]